MRPPSLLLLSALSFLPLLLFFLLYPPFSVYYCVRLQLFADASTAFASCHAAITPRQPRGRRTRPVLSLDMSTVSPRKSIDSLASGTSAQSASQFSNQLESPRAPPQKYPLRRGSTASSIASIGGILDSPSHHHGSIAESGQNGMHLRSVYCTC